MKWNRHLLLLPLLILESVNLLISPIRLSRSVPFMPYASDNVLPQTAMGCSLQGLFTPVRGERADICINFATDLLEAYVGGTGLTYGGKSFNATQIRSVVEGLNVYVFPDVNPDGRHYSQNNNAIWRRNRNPAPSGGNTNCIGVDLKRNHDFLWDFPNHFTPLALVHT